MVAGGPIAATETIAFGGADASLILTSPSAAADGSTDLYVVFCFLQGTHILTDRGEILVEKLHLRDTVVTSGGRLRSLCWTGHRHAVATRGRRSAATPVIVRKGALADNVPQLDPHITKGHSLYLDSALIPVEFLVNHRSILWDDRAQEVRYFIWNWTCMPSRSPMARRSNDARLVDGFYPYEATGDLRWTGGDATLPVEAFARFQGGVEVMPDLAATTRYRAYNGGARRAAA